MNKWRIRFQDGKIHPVEFEKVWDAFNKAWHMNERPIQIIDYFSNVFVYLNKPFEK